MKLQQIIWVLCLIILLQTGWIGLRLYQLNQRKIEAVKAEKQRVKEQEELAKEELKSVPEPEIKEKLAKGGRLWLEKVEASESGTLVLEIWAESEKEINKIDLRLFYPNEMLRVIDEDWEVGKGVVALSAIEPALSAGEALMIKTISFTPLQAGKAKIEFDFNKESLLDCNLIDENGRDILESVENGIYEIN